MIGKMGGYLTKSIYILTTAPDVYVKCHLEFSDIRLADRALKKWKRLYKFDF